MSCLIIINRTIPFCQVELYNSGQSSWCFDNGVFYPISWIPAEITSFVLPQGTIRQLSVAFYLLLQEQVLVAINCYKLYVPNNQVINHMNPTLNLSLSTNLLNNLFLIH